MGLLDSLFKKKPSYKYIAEAYEVIITNMCKTLTKDSCLYKEYDFDSNPSFPVITMIEIAIYLFFIADIRILAFKNQPHDARIKLNDIFFDKIVEKTSGNSQFVESMLEDRLAKYAEIHNEYKENDKRVTHEIHSFLLNALRYVKVNKQGNANPPIVPVEDFEDTVDKGIMMYLESSQVMHFKFILGSLLKDNPDFRELSDKEQLRRILVAAEDHARATQDLPSPRELITLLKEKKA